MGKPSKDTAPDAVSLHSNPGESSRDAFLDDDDAPEIPVDDLPPNYSDALASSEAAPMLRPADAPAPAAATRPVAPGALFVEDANNGAQVWVSKYLEDPVCLERHIRELAMIPPRPFIKVVGTHTETSRDSKGKTEKNTVTDFDVSVELTPYLYSDAQYRKSWAYLRTVENGEKTRRGTILRKRAPGAHQSIEVGTTKPSLKEWCHMYAASHAGLKVFAMARMMVGFDEEGVKERLNNLVRDTNYRGHLTVSIETKNQSVQVYNEAKINRWRMTSWIIWLFYLTLMFIFSWPYLFFRTKRWEVAIVDWPFSRLRDGRKEYVSISEDQWYNMWASAICKAVLEKRQKVLGQDDLRRAHEPQEAFNTGNTSVDGALGLFRAGIGAMNEVNRHLGWGGDC
ncbi:hypothetical protein F4778DRAFT_731161 [Xylariomycetidae sp. FL2044]|nr:hypothetical protein F4778DRAFT_731161 [Xylariomycetidae sp. FL2044]